MIDCCETEEVWDDDPDEDDDPNKDEYYDEDCGDMPYCGEDAFYDPGGRSALRAGVRNLPCPTCGQPNRLTAADVRHGYQCDECADRCEGWGG